MTKPIRLEEGWEQWPLVCLRGAGFPIKLLLSLQMPAASTASQELATLEQELLTAISSCLDSLRVAIESRQGNERRPFAKAIRQLRKGTIPQSTARLGEAEESVEVATSKAVAVEKKKRALAEAFERDLAEVQEELVRLAADDRFREAVAWQNLDGLRTGVDKIKSAGVKYQRFITNYLQRYCAKNDTIGFFGPVGWGTALEVPTSTVEAGRALLSKRTVYFEHWAIEALAEVCAADQNLWPYLIPRQLPTKYVEGEHCHHSLTRVDRIPADIACAVTACDAERTAEEVVAELSKQGIIDDPDDGYEILFSLVEQKLITWTIEIPTSGFFPESYLRDQLLRAPTEIAGAALASLDMLEAARDRVSAAAGDVAKLCDALDRLNVCFAELTGKQSTRAGGAVYAGRTLVFEDCLRDTQLELGRDFTDKLAAPISLVLASARWYSWEVAQRYKRALYETFDSLCTPENPTVPYLAFQDAFKSLFPGPDSGEGIVAEVRLMLQERWHNVIGDSREAIHLESGAIASTIMETFAASAPGWPSARHQSPDVMISAQGTEAFRRGDYQIVLGELHVGLSTPSIPLFSKEHPDPSSITKLRVRDLPDPGIARTWKTALRANLYSTSPHDFDLETGASRSRRPRSNVLSAAECVVESRDGELYVRSRRTQQSFHLLAFIEQHLIAESYSEFQILGHTTDHTPRISIDDVVISREQWRIDRAELQMIDAKLDRPSLFHELRVWAEKRGLPRYCFVKSSTETKPFYLDFQSALTMENFARYVRKAETITISEMLPDPEHSWLPDAEGNLYCSEIRLCITDPKPWQHSDN